ncbi:MAG: radical SAM protein [Treponema sp.]|jgi:histidinol dehydrogenase|nr:radical SAM protein [Treponema sp.]
MQSNDLQSIAPVENHRRREKGILVYPVYSRRSGGLSVGINLFPDKKQCPFDCPYCEVFPFSTNAVFSCGQMEADLRAAVASAREQNVPVRDICFSGNGEPSLSPDFPEALELAARLRRELVPGAELVLITNGAGLLQPHLFSLLRDAAAGPPALNIWLKLDAGTAGWYQKINRTAIPFETIIAKIKEFAAAAPVTVQTMICAVDGAGPPPEETRGREQLTLELAATDGGRSNGCSNLRKVQIYGKARPAPEDPKASPLSAEYLEEQAASLRRMFAAHTAVPPPVEVYL